MRTFFALAFTFLFALPILAQPNDGDKGVFLGYCEKVGEFTDPDTDLKYEVIACEDTGVIIFKPVPNPNELEI